MSAAIEAFYLASPRGARFCVVRRPPAGTARGVIVHVPAFAEEMNKSRNMVARQAETWAQAGWVVLQFDPRGCGDSEGELAEVVWNDWLDDVRDAHAWACAQGCGPVWLWGLRLGGLVAATAVARDHLACGLLLWQPVTSGRQHLQQFLRAWKMAQVVGKGVRDGESPQQRLAAGEVVEVAGYEISPALAAGLDEAVLPAAPALAVGWCQVAAGGEPAAPLPAFERLRAQWADAGVKVAYRAVSGPSFWQTQEIEVAPALIEASCSTLEALSAVERVV